MATNGNQDTYKDEAIHRLTDQLSALQQNENHSLLSLADKRNQAKESFGMLMRVAFGKQTDENKKFQPCKDDLEFLKRVDPALCLMICFNKDLWWIFVGFYTQWIRSSLRRLERKKTD